MLSTPPNLITYLRAMVGAWRNDPRDDAELLSRYAETHDETAFAALAWRHGMLVWWTCRNMLGDTPDAEDAFQTTFLTLTRKARQLKRKPLAGWLHCVARRAAKDIRDRAQRRQKLEQKLQAEAKPTLEGNEDRSQLYAGLDEELAGLPEKLRLPLLMHYLEGKSQVEVAGSLGCARSVLQKRLTRGEALLRERLEKRGLVLGVGSVAVLLRNSSGVPTVPGRLIENTTQAAVAFQAGTLTGDTAFGAERLLRSLSLQGVLRTSWWLAVACIVCSIGGGLAAWKMIKGPTDVAGPNVPPNLSIATKASKRTLAGSKNVVEPRDGRVDLYGDLLPKGAVTRLGTVHFRHEEEIRSLTYALDGKVLVAGGQHGGVRMWDASTGKELQRLEGGCLVSYAPISKTLAGAYEDKVQLWDLASNKLRWQIKTPFKFSISCLACTPDAKILVIGGYHTPEQEALQAWDTVSNKLLWQKDIFIRDMTLSSDAKNIAVGVTQEPGGCMETLLMLDPVSGKELWQVRMSGNGGLAFALNSKILIVGKAGETQLLDVATGKKLSQVDGYRPLAFASDGKSFACTVNNGHIRLYDTASGKMLYELMKEDPYLWSFNTLTFSPDSKVLAAGGSGNSVRQWDVATGKELTQSMECLHTQGHENAICSVACASPGKKVFTAGKDMTIRQWDAVTGRQLMRVQVNGGNGVLVRNFVRDIGKDGYSQFGFSAFSPDCKAVATSSTVAGQGRITNYLQMWDTSTGKLLWKTDPRSWKELTRARLAFALNGQTFVAWGGMGDMSLMDAVSGECIWKATLHSQGGDGWGGMAFGLGNRILAVTWKEVTLLDAATGASLRHLSKFSPSDTLWTLACSSDGRILAAGGREDEVWLWEIVSGQKIRRLPIIMNPASLEKRKSLASRILTFAFSPDGRTLAWGGQTGYTGWVRVWDLAANRETHFLDGQQGIVESLTFTPDGQKLISGGSNGTALIWDVSNPDASKRHPANELSGKQMESLWTDLLNTDVGQADSAVWTLVGVPAQAVSFLRGELQPARLPDLERIRRLVTDLNADTFADRERASKELKDLGSQTTSELQHALENKPAPEARHRIEAILNELKKPLPRLTTEELRAYRAVRVLEQIGTPAARQLLETLATGAPEAMLTREARTALQRLSAVQSAVP